MSTEKEPDYAGIARKMASKVYPSLEDFDAETGYASCMEARLRSDWETIRLLKAARMGIAHAAMDGFEESIALDRAIDAHLSKLLEPFTP